MQYIHTMEYYPALKRKEILTHAITWMNIGDLRLSEISQSQKNKYCMILLNMGYVVKFIEKESRLVVTRGWGKMGNGNLLFNGCRVSVWVDGKKCSRDGWW